MISYRQLVGFRIPTSNPNEGGRNFWRSWCRAGIRIGFGARSVPTSVSAVDGWDETQFKHAGLPPLGIDAPVWLDRIAGIPDGHVVAVLADGRVATTGFNNTFMIFRDWAAFRAAWPKSWGKNVRLLGWSEDINGTRIAAPSTITAGTNPVPIQEPKEDDMTIPTILIDSANGGVFGVQVGPRLVRATNEYEVGYLRGLKAEELHAPLASLRHLQAIADEYNRFCAASDGAAVPARDAAALAAALIPLLPDTVTSDELRAALDTLELRGTITLN